MHSVRKMRPTTTDGVARSVCVCVCVCLCICLSRSWLLQKRLNQSGCYFRADSSWSDEQCVRWDRANPFVSTRGAKRRCSLLPNYFRHLLLLFASYMACVGCWCYFCIITEQTWPWDGPIRGSLWVIVISCSRLKINSNRSSQLS